MSFGGLALGKRRGTLPFPTLSAITGLVANALGYDRGQAAELDALQDGLTVLSREELLLDEGAVPEPAYRVVDQQNVLVFKEGGSAGSRTVGPFGRHGDAGTTTLDKEVVYLTNLAFAVALTCTAVPAGRIAEALVAPARTLYLGRRCCLPGAPLVEDLVEEEPLEALRRRAAGRRLYRGPRAYTGWPVGTLPRPVVVPDVAARTPAAPIGTTTSSRSSWSPWHDDGLDGGPRLAPAGATARPDPGLPPRTRPPGARRPAPPAGPDPRHARRSSARPGSRRRARPRPATRSTPPFGASSGPRTSRSPSMSSRAGSGGPSSGPTAGMGSPCWNA